MKTLTLIELQRRLEEIGDSFANKTNDIVNKKSELLMMIIDDESLDIDEICDLNTKPMSINFRIVKRGGRISKDTGSRTGKISQSLLVEFIFRKFTDGSFDTKVEIRF